MKNFNFANLISKLCSSVHSIFNTSNVELLSSGICKLIPNNQGEFMSKLGLILLLGAMPFMAFAQPGNMSNNTDFNATYTNQTMTQMGVGGNNSVFTYRGQANATTVSGTKFYQFNSDSYSNAWNLNTPAYNTVSTAVWNGGCGGCSYNSGIKMGATTLNSYYTFNLRRGTSYASQSMSILQTTYNPTNINSYTTPTAFAGQTPTMTVTLASALQTNEFVYVAYSTDAFATSGNSGVIAVTSSATNVYTFTMPAFTNGTLVTFYPFTSTSSTAPSYSDAPILTLNMRSSTGQNNTGAYSTYSVQSWITAANGNWSTAATWTANAIPPTINSMGGVTISHNVTQDQNATASSITVNAARTLTATANTLTISNNTSGTTFTNSGTMALSGTHAVTFAGTATHTVSGTVTFNNINTTTGINFGTSSTVNGNLTLNAGGFVSTNAPTYGGASTLTYNTGAVYGAGTEWTPNALTGQGVPFNVTISTASTSVNFGASTQYRRLRGSLTISASTFLALSTAVGGDLRIGGNWTNSGTFTPNARAVFFDGSAAQTINATATGFAFLFISNTTANVTAAAAITVANSLTVDANARLDMAANTLTLTGTTSTINGFLRSAGTITGATATTLTFSSTGTYEHNFTTATGIIPTSTWSAGSTCSIIGYTSTAVTINSSYGQAFSNFTWNCTGQSVAINLLGLLTTVNGNLNLASAGTGSITYNSNSPAAPTLTIGGNCTINASINLNNGTSTPTFLIAGNFSHTGGTISRVGAGITTITLNKSTGTQTVTQSGGSITGAIVWNAGNGTTTNTVQLASNLNLGTAAFTFNTANNATTDFQTFVVSGSGTTTAATGATLLTANTAGINTTGATGSVQTTTRTFTNTGVKYIYNAASAQAAGTAVGAATSIANLTINNAAGVTLSSNVQSLTGSLTLTSGKLTLSTFDLNLGSAATVTGASSTQYIVAGSTGQLKRAALTSAFTFPVGNSAYNPITLTNSGTSDTYGVRVVDGALANANVSTLVVNRAWVVSEAVSGGSALTAVPQFNTGEEASGFNAGTTPNVGFWNGSTWSQVSAVLAGSNPFTATAGATISPSDITTGIQYFAIGKDNGLLQAAINYTWNGTTSNDWGTGTNWTPNGVPTSSDNVTISSPGTNTLSINSARTVIDFTVSGTGNFTTTSAGSLTITGILSSSTSATPSLDCASTFTISNGSSQTIPAWNYGNLNATGGARVLASTGTIGICGTFTPGAGAYTVTGSTVNFNGTGAQSINAITYNNLTISGNRGAAAITLPSGTITVGGNGSYTASNATWVNTGNTVVYNGTGAQTVAAIPGYNNLTISGARASATVTLEAGTIGVAGTFSPTATAVTYSAAGNTFDYTSTGAQTIVAFNKYNNLSNSGNGARTLPTAATVVIDGAYTPTTAAITVSTSVIDFSSASSQNIPASSYYSITNTGNGNRVWASSGNIDINGTFTPGSGTHTITGSTMRFLNTTAGPFTIPVVTTNISGSSYNNVVINGSNASPSVYSTAGTTMGIAGDLTITAGHLRMSSGGTSGTLNVNGTLTMNGGSLVLTNSGTLTDVGTLNLFGNLVMSSGSIGRTSGVANGFINFAHPTATQTWTYSGGFFSILSGFGIPVNVGTGSSTNTLSLASNVTASSITVNVLSGSTLNFGTNTFASAGSMSFVAANGSNLITANAGGFASTGATGSVQSTGSRTFNVGANYTYNGTAAQATGTGMTGANNLVFNNTSGANPAITLSASSNVTGTLTLTSGIVQLGANNLTISNTASGAISGASSTSFIQTNSTGELRRGIAGSIASSTTYDYPLGTSTNYTPASYTFTATGNAFTLHSKAVGATHPSMDINGTQTDYYANRYWTTNTSGSPSTYSYSSTYTYISGDLQGTAANVRLNKWSGSWSMDNTSSATSTSLTSGSLNETSFSLATTAEWTGRFNPSIVTYTWTGTNSSSWSDPGNWSPGSSVEGPTFIDNIIINTPGTNTLNVTGTRSITNITVSGTGNFTITSGDSLVVIGSITNTTSATPSMACGSLVQITSTSAQTIPAWSFGDLNATGGDRILAASGTIGICGVFTRGAGAYTVSGSTVDFNGTGAQTIPAGTYNNLTISQNRSAASITLATGTIDVAGVLSPTLTNYSVINTGNTVNYSSASAQTIPALNYNNITNTGNGARTWSNSGVIDVNGTFTFGSGAHTTSGSTIRYSTTAAGANTLSSFTSANSFHYHNLELVGGASTTWVLASGFSPSISGNLSLTGAGTFTLATNTTANSMNVGGDLTVSGTGTLRVANTTTATLVNTLTVTGNTTVSNGVLNLVGSSSSTTVQGNLVTTDLTISGTGQILLDAAANTSFGAATVNGNFTMTSTTTNAVNFGSGAGSNTNNLINIKGNFSKSGTGTIGMTGGFATTAGFNFNGTGTQTWSHNGTAMSGGTITIAAGATLQLLSNITSASSANTNAITVTGTLDCGSLSVVASNATNTFVLSGTGLLKTASATGVAGSVIGFTAAPTYTTGANFEFNGTDQSTGFSSFTGITTANSYTITWTGTGGLTLDKAVQLNALNLTNNGLFYIGNFDVTMASAATIGGSPFSSSKMIVTNGTGYLVRSHTAAGVGIPFTWPIGDTTGVDEYSPVTVNNISVALAGSLAYRVVDGVHPNMSPASAYASRYWPSRYTGSSYNYTNATFTYAATDIVTGPETSFGANVWDPINSAWLDFTSTSSASGNLLTITSGPTSTNMPAGATQFDFAPRIPVPVYYRSVATGSWTNASTWEISSDPTFVSPAAVAATFPPNAVNSNGVIIRNGHTVTSSATTSIDQLTIESGGILSLTNNAFTIANGTGTDMQINSGGTLQISAGLSASMVLASGGAMQVDGLFKMTGTGTNPTVSAVGTITVSSTGTYEHNVNAGAIPTSTWQTGSTCLVTGTTSNAPTGLAQAFHHFTVNSTLTASVNCSGALQTINGKFKLTTNSATQGWRLSATTSYTLNVADSLIITNGILDAVSGTLASGIATVNANGAVVMNGATSQFVKSGPSTAVININNNFTQNAGVIEFNSGGSSNTTWNIKGDFLQGGTIQRTNGGTHVLNFNKATGVQTWTQTGTYGTGAMTINVGSSTTNTLQLLSNISLGTSAQVLNVSNGATLDMGPYVMTGSSSTFAVGATGAVKFGNINGITTSPTASGNVQTLTRTFPATATYFYNGTSNQVTGNALPLTLTGTGSLNIDNAGLSGNNTVSLTTNGSTTPTLNILQGLFAIGTGQTINISNNGSVNVSGTGDFAVGTTGGKVDFAGLGTWTGSSNPYNVEISNGVNFGAGTVTIQNGGTLNMQPGAFVNTNAPAYASGSNLQYATGGTYNRGLEWSTTTGKGYPHHVNIGSSTILSPARSDNAYANVVFRCGGNLTISTGSSIYMDNAGNNMTEDLVVTGNLNLQGALSGSATLGSDIFVGGNWTNSGTTSNFFPNNRAVTFNGTVNQNIGGSNTSANPFAFVTINNAAGVTLTYGQEINNQLTFSNGNLTLGNFDLVMNGLNTPISGFSNTKFIITNGSGNLYRNFNSTSTVYPVGPSSTSYNPLTLSQLGTADNIGVRVATTPSYSNSINDNNQMVLVEYFLSEVTPGGNNLTTSFQWNASNEGSTFNRLGGVYQGNWTGLQWVLRPSLPTSGSNPYTSTSTVNYTGNLINTSMIVGNITGIFSCLSTSSNGSWNDPNIWLSGIVPPVDASVCINHPITIGGSDVNIGNVTINTSGSLTVAPNINLNIADFGGIVNNSGATSNFGQGNVVFTGIGSVSGLNPITIKNLTINRNTTLSTSPTIDGNLTINSGAFIIAGSPTYSSTSTLIYNTGGAYSVSNEWTGNGATGLGIPQNVTIQGTTLNMPATSRGLGGNMNIASGSLVLNSTTGDLFIGGNWTRNPLATFTTNGRAVFFNGSANQTVSITGGGTESFSYLLVNKSSGNLILDSVEPTNINVTANVGNVLEVNAGNTIDLNGRTMAITGTGGNINLPSGIANINGGVGSIFSIQNGTKTVNPSGGATLNFGSNVTVALNSGINFGPSTSTINGTLQIALGGFVSSNAPTYATGSTLRYFTGSAFGRGTEWSTNAGPGYPHNVVVDQNGTVTTVNLAAGSSTCQIAGNLSINNGAIVNLGAMTNPLVVSGDVTIGGATSGSLTLGSNISGDIKIGGNLTRNAGGTLTQNGREVEMNGSVLQTITGVPTFDFLAVNNSASSVRLTDNSTINNRLRLSNGLFDLNGLTCTLTNGSKILRVNGTMSASPTVIGSNVYDLEYQNSVTSSFEYLASSTAVRDLIITTGNTLTLGDNRTFNRDLTLSGGDLNLGGFTLTARGRATAPAFSGSITVSGGGTRTITGPAGSIFDITGLGGNLPNDYTKTVSSFGGSTLSFDSDVLVRIGDGAVDFGAGSPTTINGTLQVLLGGSVGQILNPCYYGVNSLLRFSNTVDYQIGTNDKTWASGSLASGNPGIPFNVEVMDVNTDLQLQSTRALRGNLTITNGTFTLTPAYTGTFNIGGNWTRSGATSAFNHNSKKVVFDRQTAGNQNLTVSSGVSVETFFDLEVSLLSGNLVSSPITILNNLNFISGKIDLGANSLTIGTSLVNGTITGASSSNYVITNAVAGGGNIKAFTNTNTTYNFPVGDVTNYSPMAVTLTTGAQVGSFITTSTVQGAHPNMLTGTPPTKYIARYWSVEPTGLAIDPVYNVSYSYAAADEVGTGTLYPVKYSTSTTTPGWQSCPGSTAVAITGTSGANDNVLKTFTWNGLTTFSDFSGAGDGSPLPVTWLNFDAQFNNATNNVDVTWTTASEINNDYFEVLRSNDAVNFNVIGTVDGAGNSSLVKDYTFEDTNPLSGISYYKIRQVDFNGQSDNTEIRAVSNLGGVATATLFTYPNPLIGQDLTIVYSNLDKGNWEYRLVDITGKIVLAQRRTSDLEAGAFTLNLEQLPAGVYLFQLNTQSQNFTRKITISK